MSLLVQTATFVTCLHRSCYDQHRTIRSDYYQSILLLKLRQLPLYFFSLRSMLHIETLYSTIDYTTPHSLTLLAHPDPLHLAPSSIYSSIGRFFLWPPYLWIQLLDYQVCSEQFQIVCIRHQTDPCGTPSVGSITSSFRTCILFLKSFLIYWTCLP